MDERIKKLMLFLIIGWFFGYVHHSFVANTAFDLMRLQEATLKDEILQLKALPVVKKVSVKATAYSNDIYSINVPKWRDGRTATNKLARRGRVAADWQLFPPGTRLYIPGYGEAVVEDRGGAVRGYHLDLFVDTREEALKWGVKQLEVYVLEPARYKRGS